MRVHYDTRPDAVEYISAPDGTWVYFRENISQSVNGDGSPYIADEYCIKLKCKENVARARVGANPSAWLAKAQEQPLPTPTDAERITALEAENSMLLECVLEMSELLYA